MQEWMLVPLQRYAEFSGRSRRKEYWYYALLLFIINIIASIIEKMMGWTFDDLGLLSGLIALLTIIPSIAVGVRRLHDIDRSGW